ncbi:MAG: MFS transporter [Thermoleophilaceae bacterium]|nr:MFS transporter [Thermoleophilaceae bacterium]
MSTTPASPPVPPAAPTPVSGASPRPRGRLLTLPVVSWVFYDFANTIFSYVVLTRYFTEWVVIERGRPDWYIGVMSACVALALAVALPFFGALADRRGRNKPFLIGFTLASVAATAALGFTGPVLAALVVAGVAIFAFNSAEAQYHPLLATVAAPAQRSRVSGIGVGVGYLGALLALIGLGAVVPDGENQRAFVPTAALFGLFALPCLLLVHDRRRPAGMMPSLAGLGASALGQVVRSVRAARGRPHGRFLIARFLYVDAIATVIAFMTVYARRTGDFSAGEIDALLAASTVCAILGALTAGLVSEWIGPRRVVLATLVVVGAAMLAAGLSGAGALLWVVGPLVGAALGSVTASDRILMLALLPPERRSEGFGLYALIGKVSNGFGPLVLWSGTIWLLSEGLEVAGPLVASRAAVCVLALTALGGAAVLRGVPDSR